MTCPKCNQEHDPSRCTAHNRAGDQCGRNPMKGGSVCRAHGGASPQVKVKAEERIQVEAAENEIRKLWVGLADATPVADPVEAMSQLAGSLQGLLDQVGLKVNEITSMAAGASMGQIRGELVLLERVAALLARLLDAMARLGIEERKAQFQQNQAEAITQAFRLGLGAVASSLLTPADKALMVTAFVKGLGWSEDELQGGGDPS